MFHSYIPYSGYTSQGANFPEWLALCFSTNFPDIDKILAFINWHNIHDSFAVAVHKEYSLVWSNPLSHRVFIVCNISSHTWPLELLQLQL